MAIFYAKDRQDAIKYAKRTNKESGVADINIRNIHLAREQAKHSAGFKTFTDTPKRTKRISKRRR